jgi:spermidine synthase
MLRNAALLLTVLTGFSALVYEVAWQKYLAALLGSHAEATAAVLAIFLGGLAVGYTVFGRLTARLLARARATGNPPHLLRVYGGVECAIGAYAFAFPQLFGAAQWLSLRVPGHDGLGLIADTAIAAALIGPPTLLMGSTIPLLTLALSGSARRAARMHARIYGCNTLGAFAGALVGGFFLIPWLGLDAALFAMGVLNLAAGGAFVLLDRFAARGARLPAPTERNSAARTAPSFAAYGFVALLAGFGAMTLQTTLNRIGALAFGASPFTFAMLVAVFVLCIALGSLTVARYRRISASVLVGSQWLLVLLLAALDRGISDTPYYAHALRMLFRTDSAAFYPYYLAAFCGMLVVLALPIGLSGALLPMLFQHLRREVDSLGLVAGRIYSWNTVGSLLGALLGGYILLLWLELEQVYRIALAAYALGAAILTHLVMRIAARRVVLLALIPALLLIHFLPSWDLNRLTSGTFRAHAPRPESFLGPDAFFAARPSAPIIFHEDDPTATISVRESPPQRGRIDRSLFTNGKSDGDLISDYANMGLTALIPALLAERAEHCFVIGLGLGITTGELAALHDTRSIHVAEISQGVIDAAPLFEAGNLAALRSPKVSVERNDAYRALAHSQERWDLIVAEPSNPWVTGVEMLYSVEFLRAARARLEPGGVMAQWIHTYEMDQPTLQIVLHNYTSVFPKVSVWFTMSKDLLLLGFAQPQAGLDVSRLEERYRQPDFSAGFARSGIRSFAGVLAHELLPLCVLRTQDFHAPLHTLRRPILSHYAARAFFVGDSAELLKFANPQGARVGARNSLLRRYGLQGSALSEAVLAEATEETCRVGRNLECATLFAYGRYAYPGSESLHASLLRARQALNARRVQLHEASAPAELAEVELDQLTALFSTELPEPRDPLVQAPRVSRGFARYYHHAVPFDRRSLQVAWARCTSEACDGELRRFAPLLGPIGSWATRAALAPPNRAEARLPTP